MRYICLALVCMATSVFSYADGIDEVEGLRAAIDAHEAALLSGDNTKISSTVRYPHVQFYPDGRVMQFQEQADLPPRRESQGRWRVSDTTLVMYEPGIAIVRASFERIGDEESAGLGAGLWCYVLSEGEWRIYWRHYLGRDTNG